MAKNDRCQDCGRLLPADDFSSVCCDACYLARGIDLYPTEKEIIPGVTDTHGHLIMDAKTGLPAFGFPRNAKKDTR